MSTANVDQKPRNLARSALAVFAGLLTVVVLSIATDIALQKTLFPAMNTPSAGDGLLALALGYRAIITALGGFVTARLAPRNPLGHAVILGVIGITAATLGTVANWNLGHHWYPIALIVTALPCTWLGGKVAS
jgi:hypothetical protein